jgi:hypothetical protein
MTMQRLRKLVQKPAKTMQVSDNFTKVDKRTTPDFFAPELSIGVPHPRVVTPQRG